MSFADGQDKRNYLKIPEDEFMRNKETLRMLKFKIRVYKTALYNEQRAYKKMLSTQDKRFEQWQPKYKTRKELDDAYLVGAVDDTDYRKERYAIWQVYSDRGHINNLKWLEKMVEVSEKNLADFEAYLQSESERRKEAREKRDRLRKRHNMYIRRYRHKKKKKALQERWEFYGIG